MSDEEAVRAATNKFYEAINQILTGRGTALMVDSWHHGDSVTSAHPTGDWARGWDQILASWEAFSLLGAPEHGGAQLLHLRVNVRGDMAYTTGVFVAAPTFGGDRFNVTNVLEKIDGVWKLVHHHADHSPGLAAAMAKLIG